jgi:hypothetical protein
MLYEVLIGICLLLLSPYLLAFFLRGVVYCQELTKQLKKKRGIEGAVAKWQELTPEQRMEAELHEAKAPPAKSIDTTNWLATPTPDEEKRMMNEAVYRNGLVEPKPTTFEEEKK